MTEHRRVPRAVTSRAPAPADTKLQGLMDKRDTILKSMRRAEALSGEMGGELWKEIKGRADAQVKKSEEILDNFDNPNVTNPMLYGALGERRLAIRILGIGEFAKAGDDFDKELQKVEEEIGRLSS